MSGKLRVVFCQVSIRTQKVSVGFKIDMVELFRGSLRFAEILEQERVPISELIPVGASGEYHTQLG